MTINTSNTAGKITITSLDFDTIKGNFISYLKSQDQFSDYNFEGSGLNVLLDILAYNTFYNAFYLNMVANEMFLDTAVVRSTVVSHAKSLGYIPQSTIASQATVSVAITKANGDLTSSLTLPRFTAFSSSSLDGQSYNFVTIDDVTAIASGNTISFSDLIIKEGVPTVKTFVMDNSTNPTQTFDLVDPNVDTSTIQIIVQQSITNLSKTSYILAEDATTVTGDSAVYFIEEGQNGNYIVYFGDGIIGKKLSDGNIIIISYLVTNADAANFVENFSLQSNLLSGSTSNVTTVNGSAGGSPIEDVNSIKFSAPKSYIAQNRAVTKNDYIALINKNYPYFDAVTVWGGETVTPPVYGVVYVCAKPKSGFAITTQQKQFLTDNIIKPISVLTVTPIWVDADYNYLMLNLDVEYNSTQTTLTAAQVKNLIAASVQNYANLNLNTFNSTFKVSRLLRAVDDSDNSIESSTTDIVIEKRLIPTLKATATYVMNTGIQLQPDTLTSSPAFTIADNGGVLRQAFIEEIPNSFSGITNIGVIAPGSGYTTPPRIIIFGDGIGANAYPIVVSGKIQSVVLDKSGSEYSTATAVIEGDTGTGAKLQVILQETSGTLRMFYYDSNNNKVVLNSNAGSINYLTGVITLNSFNPVSISNQETTLNIHVKPVSLVFGSVQERIITIDPNDPNSVAVNLIDINI